MTPWVILQGAAVDVPWSDIAPSLIPAVIIFSMWARGMLLAKPHVDRIHETHKETVKTLNDTHATVVTLLEKNHQAHLERVERAHSEKLETLVDIYKARINDMERVVDRAGRELDEQQEERRAAQELLQRTLGVTERALDGTV